MNNHNKRVDRLESEAVEGILLLTKEQKVKKKLLAIICGGDEKGWIFNIYDKKIRIKEGNSSIILFYLSSEKTWFIFLEHGSAKTDSCPLQAAKVLRNDTIIEIGDLFFVFEIKFTIKKEYKKLLVEIILDSPDKKLSLSSIYEKLEAAYGLPKERKASWKNSIRCVLSESKVFYKLPKETKNGRGSHWLICKTELKKMDLETVKRCEKKLPVDFLNDKDCPAYYRKDLDPDCSDISSEDLFEGTEFVPQRYSSTEVRYPTSNLPVDNTSNFNWDMDLETKSCDGVDDFIDELSSEMSCISMKPKKKRKRR